MMTVVFPNPILAARIKFLLLFKSYNDGPWPDRRNFIPYTCLDLNYSLSNEVSEMPMLSLKEVEEVNSILRVF